MLAHYSHVRVEAKRKAVDALSGGVQRRVMAQTTTQIRHPPQQVNGRPVGTRTPDLYRVKVPSSRPRGLPKKAEVI